MTIFIQLLVFVLLIIFLLSLPTILIGLVKPAWLKFLFRSVPTRKQIALSLILINVIALTLMGVIIGNDKKDFPNHNTASNQKDAKTKTENTLIKPLPTKTITVPTKKINLDTTANWLTYFDSISNYSFQYPSNYYIDEAMELSDGSKINNVDVNIVSTNLTTDDDKNAFSIMGTNESSFSDNDLSPQDCKNDGHCTYSKVVNAHKVPLDCYYIANNGSANIYGGNNYDVGSYVCRYVNINTDLVIWFDQTVDKNTRNNILNSFQFVSNPESSIAIKQEVDAYETETLTLNNQAVSQMNIISGDLSTIASMQYPQVESVIPHVKSDLSTAQTTFQQIYTRLNSVQVPPEMAASHSHYAKAIYAWIATTKVIQAGVNSNNESKILSAKGDIRDADSEITKATGQMQAYDNE